MNILGISAFVHDSAACLIMDGRMIANAEEERFNREKHTDAFPVRAVEYALQQGGITLADVDVIAFNWNPHKSLLAEVLKFVLVPLTYLKVYRYCRPPKNFRSILASLRLRRTIDTLYPGQFRGRLQWVDHHLAHAASSYFLAPFAGEAADVVVVDGHGDNSSASVYTVKDGRFRSLWTIPIFDSLGILYTNFTNFLGFANYQEGKTMALASFGRDSFKELFQRIVRLRPDGTYTVADKNYLRLWRFMESRLDPVLGNRREPKEPLEQRHFDIAFSMQNRIKEAILHMIGNLSAQSGNDQLCLSGGLFLNCDINREIVRTAGYRHVFIPPFPSDSGGAAGAALYAAHVQCREKPANYVHFSPYQGPEFSDEEIESALRRHGARYRQVDEPWQAAAELLRDQKIIGWFQGRMECGPRALGNRSILAPPFSREIREYLNADVKKREYFRPFAPVATVDAALKYFELREPLSELTRYMLVTTSVREEFREILPGITHVDGTARIQVVTEEGNPPLYRLLRAFEAMTGYAVLINTSFNLQEPIVCSPDDALACFANAPLDALVIGHHLVSRETAP